MVAAEEVEDAGEVARIAYVHRVGQRGHRGAWPIDARVEVVQEDVVAVVGGDEVRHGQPHTVRDESGGKVTEVAAGHTHDETLGTADAVHLGVGVEVIEGLRQEARDVDGVGRGELQVGVEVGVDEGGLDERLTVVEDAVHLQRGDVTPEGGELAFLNRADLALGVEYKDADAGHIEETVGYGAARVARGGHEHVDLATRPLTGDEVAEHAGHEPCADVFEGQRGAVEEFEGVDRVRDGHDGRVKSQRVLYDAAEIALRHIVAKEGAGHVEGDLVKGHVLHPVDERAVERGDAFGHE